MLFLREACGLGSDIIPGASGGVFLRFFWRIQDGTFRQIVMRHAATPRTSEVDFAVERLHGVGLGAAGALAFDGGVLLRHGRVEAAVKDVEVESR